MFSALLRNRSIVLALLATAGALVAAGCGSGVVNTAATSGTTTGPAFVIGTDAPLTSVTSFQVQLESMTAVDANGNSVSLITGQPVVDFARFNGLQTLLDMNDVPQGSYKSVSITLNAQNASIGYLNTSGGGAPTIQTAVPTFTTTSVNVPLATPLVVAHDGAPAGLRLDFNLRKSLTVDGNGNFTVNPNFNIRTVGKDDSGGYIDEFTAGVVSVDTANQTFVVQGPHGQQFTIAVNGQTEWENNESISSLTTNSIVQVSGKLDKADLTLDADEVAILSQNRFYAAGQVTYVTPATGTATNFDLYVRGLLPTTTGLQLGQIAHVDLTGSEKFFIYRMHNTLTNFLFNSSSMVAGQSVAIGGPASGAADANAVTVNRVVLRHWGFNGTVVAGSVNASAGTFQIKVNGFAGLLIPETVTVYVSNHTAFREGLNTLTDVGDNANVRVVGLLLRPNNGSVVLLAQYVDELN